jgi:thiol:disulfide interchange protein
MGACSEQETMYSQEVRPVTYQAANGSSAASSSETCIDMDKLAKQSLDEKKPVYIEFTADWCGYCKKYERETLNTAEGQRILQKVIFIQANYDQNRSLANQYGFTGIPAGVLLKADANGKLQLIDKHVGGFSASELDAFLCKGL